MKDQQEQIQEAKEAGQKVLTGKLLDTALDAMETVSKSLGNTDTNTAKSNVKDIVFWGDGDTFKLISKASSVAEGWMKSTKAMQMPTGCVIQVTTQQGDNIAEALTFVPGARLIEHTDRGGKVISRSFK